MYLSRRLHRQREPDRAAGHQRAVADCAPGELPIGVQLTGRMFDEATLLRSPDACQRETSWHRCVPRL